MPKRPGIILCAIGAMLALWGGPTNVQAAFPEREVTIIVPYPPGGGTDQHARLLANGLSKQLRVPVLVVNRPGANTVVGALAVAKAPPDGYTILFNSVALAINPALNPSLPYDPDTAFAPITIVASSPMVLVAGPAIPANSPAELVAWVRANPGKVNYGSYGIGSSGHLAASMLEQLASLKMEHIPYQGNAPATLALMGGQAHLLFSTVSPVVPLIRGGKLKAIAVAGERRATSLPDIPTFREAGIELIVDIWFGFLAPSGTPREIIDALHRGFSNVLEDRELRERLTSQDLDVAVTGPEVFKRRLAEETKRWSILVNNMNIR